MNHYRYISGLLLLAMLTLLSCHEYEVEPDSSSVATLALNVSTQQNTRLSADATQNNNNFRDIPEENWLLIPFDVLETNVSPPIGSDDQPVSGIITSMTRVGTTFNYLNYHPTNMVTGTDSYLCYARATASGSKFVNGSTVASYGTNYYPANISFAPDYICATALTATTAGSSLLDYLNAIMGANVTISGTNHTWRESEDNKLKKIFETVINKKTDNNTTSYGLIAGSSNNVRALVSELWKMLEYAVFANGTTEKELKDKIIDKIKNGTTYDATTFTVSNLGTGRNDFPGSIDLPDGAVGLQWNNTTYEFELKTTTATETSANTYSINLENFVYPAELYYYANSRIKTSSTSKKDEYTNTQWATETGVLSKYEYDNSSFNGTTRSIAIKEPLRYGVGCLKASFWATASTLNDADGNAISLTHTENEQTVNNFPLTGLFLGGQQAQKFDFTPASVSAGSGIIYDPQDGSLFLKYAASEAAADARNEYFYTLSLPTNADENVIIVLELQNNSGTAFKGANGGVIYPGTKFYLTGEITPATAGLSIRTAFDKAKKTEIKLKIGSLAHACNILPDLDTAAHELIIVDIGIKDWGDGGSTDKEVYNW